jgi:hypothetical protein
MNRSVVYRAIDGERDYQDSFIETDPTRSEASERPHSTVERVIVNTRPPMFAIYS